MMRFYHPSWCQYRDPRHEGLCLDSAGMSRTDVTEKCPDCGHVMHWHRTTKGCIKTLGAQGLCRCERRFPQ